MSIFSGSGGGRRLGGDIGLVGDGHQIDRHDMAVFGGVSKLR